MRGVIVGVGLFALLAACGDPPPPGAALPGAAEPGQGDAATAMLREITHAERTRVYAGYKTAVHGADGEGRRTRMRVERLADGRMVLEWESGGKTARRWVVRSRHRWIDDPSLLLENYDVVVTSDEEEDVAWRAVVRVELRPRHAGRPSLTLLVDAATRLVLAERLRDYDGVQRFAWQFDTIDYDPEPFAFDEAEVVAAPGGRADDTADADEGALTLGTPPEGFRRVARRRTKDGGLTDYWSDGLAAFVFRQKPAADPAGIREGDLETRECAGRASVSGLIDGVDIALLGNLPTRELEAVAASLRIRP